MHNLAIVGETESKVYIIDQSACMYAQEYLIVICFEFVNSLYKYTDSEWKMFNPHYDVSQFLSFFVTYLIYYDKTIGQHKQNCHST